MASSCRLRSSCYVILCMSFAFLLVSKIGVARAVTSVEKASLMSFMMSVFSDPEHALRNWNSSGVHVCEWTGVECNEARSAVVQLVLAGKSLGGTISPALGGLSSLQVLDLSKNYFLGHIPVELGSLFQLGELSLAWNLLQGNIPSGFGSLRSLIYIDLGNNRLSGDVPAEFFCNVSSSLQYVDLSNNSFSGEIPLTDNCEMKDLRYLLLWSNRLTGRVPPCLANSTRMEWLDLESNFLTGELPSHIFGKMPHLQFLYLSYNQFTAQDGDTNLETFFDALSNSSGLRELELAANNLSGKIPPGIGCLPKSLVQIHLAENLLYGTIPPQISNLINLTLLNLSSNLLNGTIPTELCRMGRLERVYLSKNLLSGEIPSALGNLPHLGLLDLSQNRLSGAIPNSFANISQLRRLFLFQNQLSGTIPPSLGECVNLEILDLSYNRISGAIPGEVAGLGSLKIYLNLSHNDLSGNLPLELSKMDMVLAVDLSSNNLSGAIPSQLGSCIALEYLNLSGNSLEGSLPSSIGLLPYLQALDLSYNHMIGPIPRTIPTSSTLQTLNFSFNNFSGNVSAHGAFSNLTVESFLGNKGLCGSLKGMRTCKKRRYYHLVVMPILLSLVITPIFCLCGYPLVLRSRFRTRLAGFSRGDVEHDDNPEPNEHKFPKLTYEELMQATEGFGLSNLVGSGQFGHVYKGVLRDNTRIAVKVLDLETAGGISQSFKRECQILRRTRHRNLIRIITICSRPDFKALVFPLMSMGSLERYLYPSQRSAQKLDLIQLVSLCSDVAEAVAYLHHHSPVRVVHCDLKPSNILLDDDMKALVTDFGIAKVIKGGEETAATTSSLDSVSISSTDGLLCGSVGYIAPEYGMGKRASTQGDVYSFGVLVLEIITGKRPTDPLFNHESSLHEWVKSHYPHKIDTIIEQALNSYCCSCPLAMPEYTSAEDVWRDVLVEMIELGLICTQFSPSVRPSMLDVAQEMGRLRQYLSNENLSLLTNDRNRTTTLKCR